MSAALVVAFSDLLNKPKDTLASMARSGAVLLRLRRRDAEDLVLTTASRREQEHTVVSAATRLTTALLRQADQGRDRLLEALPEVFAWTRFLPEDDRRLFLTEFADALRAVEDLDNLAPVAHLINEWKHTAEIHADPHLAAILTQDGDDYGSVPEPDVLA
jgi:hypothetical protein